MITYTSHGTHCRICNRLARTAYAKVKETGHAHHETICRGNTIHHAASINNGKNNRTTGDRKDTQ